MAKTYQNQAELAQNMASSLYALADHLDYVSEQISKDLENLVELGVFKNEIDLVHNIFRSEYVPKTNKIIGDIIKDHIGYLKKQQDAIGAVIDETKQENGSYKRKASEFRFYNNTNS